MECQLKWGERNLGGLNCPFASFTPITNPYPLTLLPWQLTPLVWKSEGANVYVCTHERGSIVWSLWLPRCCSNASCNCDKPQNYFSLYPLPSLPAFCNAFLPSSSLPSLPSFCNSLLPLFPPPHCFLCLTHYSPPIRTHTDLQQEGDLLYIAGSTSSSTAV